MKTFLEGTFVYCWIVKLFPPIVMFATVQTRFNKVLFLVSLGVNVYPWEIVCIDFVTYLTKSSEFHLDTILASCLPSEMA